MIVAGYQEVTSGEVHGLNGGKDPGRAIKTIPHTPF